MRMGGTLACLGEGEFAKCSEDGRCAKLAFKLRGCHQFGSKPACAAALWENCTDSFGEYFTFVGHCAWETFLTVGTLFASFNHSFCF